MRGNHTKIIVRGLAKNAREILGADEATLDSTAGFSINLSKDVESLTDTNKIKTEGVLGFSLPFSYVNDIVFSDSANPLELDRNRIFYNVIVLMGQHQIPFNRLRVTQRNPTTKEWELELTRSPDHWVDLATQMRVNEIDIDFVYFQKTLVSDSWDAPAYVGDYSPGSNPVWWPLVDFGNWVDQTVKPQNTDSERFKSVSTEDFRPFISLAYLLKRGFCQMGWTLDGVLIETEFIRRLWVYLLKPDFYIGQGNGYKYGRAGRIIGRLHATEYALAPGTPKLYFDALDFAVGTTPLPFNGSLSGQWRLGIKSVLPFLSKYRFVMKCNIRNDNATPITMVFHVAEISPTDTNNNFETGEILSPDFFVEVDANSTKFAIVELEALINFDQKAAIVWGNPDFFNVFIESGLYFEVEPNNKSFTRFDYIDVPAAINPVYTFMELFKGYVHMVRGQVETDHETKTVYVHPKNTTDVWGEVVPGFLKKQEPAIDIRNEIIHDSVKQIPVRNKLKRYTQLSFADANDAYIESLNLVEPAHSRTILNGIDLPDEIDELPNPFFEPTLDGQMRFIKQQGRELLPRVPRMWDNMNDERSFEIGPRVLFAFGRIEQLYPTPVTAAQTYTGWFWDGKNDLADFETEFGYATMIRDWDVEPTPVMDANIVFGRAPSDLFVNFYLGITNEHRGGIILDALMKMTPDQYMQAGFRDMYSFVLDGRPYRVPMTSIRDFQSRGGITPVQFLADPAMSECCDVPCGCKFLTCLYYQDFGLTVRQSTVDDIAISSFKVDDVELLDAPLGLGVINIIDLAGLPYFTNLVDALNSVAAPYFVFSYSTRLDSSNRLRYFSIKRPACTGFEITIIQNGDPIYFYSNAIQGEYDGATLIPLGYGATSHDEPFECIETTEY